MEDQNLGYDLRSTPALETLVDKVFETGMQPYSEGDEAFREDPGSFQRVLRSDIAVVWDRGDDLARYHRTNLGRLWYNLEGDLAEGRVDDTLNTAAATLASPTFLERMMRELVPERRAGVERLARNFAQFVHGDMTEPTRQTTSIAHLYVALDATGRDEARFLVGRMLHEDRRHLLPELARGRGLDDAKARAVPEQRQEAAIARDGALGRKQRPMPGRDHGDAFGLTRGFGW